MLIQVSTQLFKIRRPLTLCGDKLVAGDIIDITEYELPRGRARNLEKTNAGDFVYGIDESDIRRRGPQAEAEAPAADPVEDPTAVKKTDVPDDTEDLPDTNTAASGVELGNQGGNLFVMVDGEPVSPDNWTMAMLMKISRTKLQDLAVSREIPKRGKKDEVAAKLMESVV